MPLFKPKGNAPPKGKPPFKGKPAPGKPAPRGKAAKPAPAKPARPPKAAVPAKPKPNKEVPRLIKSLSGTNWVEIEKTASKLADIGIEAIDNLCAALKDKQFFLVRNAAFVLGWIAHPRAFTPLATLLENESPHLREAAAVSLGSLGDSRAAPVLAKRLEKEPESLVRIALVEAIEKCGDSSSAAALTAVLGDQDLKVRLSAVKALGEMGILKSVTIDFPGFAVSGGARAPRTATTGAPSAKPVPAASETPSSEAASQESPAAEKAVSPGPAETGENPAGGEAPAAPEKPAAEPPAAPASEKKEGAGDQKETPATLAAPPIGG